MTDTFSPKKRRLIMQSVRRKSTGPEQAVAQHLRVMGVVFRANEKSLPGQPDIYIPSAGMVILVHGCFWHGHHACRKGRRRPLTRKAYWRKKIHGNQRRDRRVARKLRTLGLRVFTVWECSVRHGIPAHVLRALHPPAVDGTSTR